MKFIEELVEYKYKYDIDLLIKHTNNYKEQDFVQRIVQRKTTCQKELSKAYAIGWGSQADFFPCTPKNSDESDTSIETLLSFLEPFTPKNIDLQLLNDKELVRAQTAKYLKYNYSNLRALIGSIGTVAAISSIAAIENVNMNYIVEYFCTGLSTSLGISSLAYALAGFRPNGCENFLTYKKVHNSIARRVGGFLRYDYAEYVQERLDAKDLDYKAYK